MKKPKSIEYYGVVVYNAEEMDAFLKEQALQRERR